MIDQDRDGIIGSDDLAAIYNQIGRPTNYKKLSQRRETSRQISLGWLNDHAIH